MEVLERNSVFGEVEEGKCKRCGENDSLPKDMFCQACGEDQELDKMSLKVLWENLDGRWLQSEFSVNKYSAGYTDWLVFETLVRLSSPITGEYYDTVADLRNIVNRSNSAMSDCFKRLEADGKITIYHKNKNTRGRVKRGLPIIRVEDIKEPDVNPPIRNLQLA